MKPRLPLLLASTAVAAVGCGGSTSSTSPSTTNGATTTLASSAPVGKSGAINVELSEWSVTAAAATAKAGKITFDAVNVGKIPHELVVLKTTPAADKLGTGSRIPETNNVGETGDVPVGASKTFSLNLKPGHYSLVCNLPGHYMSGMHADFTVQ